MTKTAKPLPEAVTVLVAAFLEKDLWLEVPCENYDAFAALPAAVEYAGQVCGKTGWSSDNGRAYFSSGRKVAVAV